MLFEQNTRKILKDPVLEAEMKLNRKTVLNFKEDVIGVLPNAPNAPNHTIQDFKYGAFGISKERDICGWDKFTSNRDYNFPIQKGTDPFTKWNFSYDRSNPQISNGIEAKDEVERLNQFETKGGQLKDYVVPDAKNHNDIKSFGDVGHNIVIKERADEMMADHADDPNFENYRKQAQRRARARNVNFTASNLQPASDAGSSVSSLSSSSNPTTMSSSHSSSSSSSDGDSGNGLFERSIGTVGTNTQSSSSSRYTRSVASSGHSVQPLYANSFSPINGSNSSSSTKGIRIFPALHASDHSVHPPSTESDSSAPKRSAPLFKRMGEASGDANYEASSSSTSTLSTKSTRAKQLKKKGKLLEKQKKAHKPNTVYAFNPSTDEPMKHLGLMPRAEARALEHSLSLQYKKPRQSKGESAESKVEVESLVDSKKEASLASLKSIDRPTRISKVNFEVTRNGHPKSTYEYANDLIKQLNGEIRDIKKIGEKIGEQLYKYYGITPNASLKTKRQVIGYLETLAKPPAGASAPKPPTKKAQTKTK